MNLQTLKNRDSQKGFTIVELLIVIVVIAILAAITIVAYNGVQNRAKTSAGQSLANSVVKKAQAYNTIKSALPANVAGFNDAEAPEAKLDANSGVVAGPIASGDDTVTGGKGGKQVGYALATGGATATVTYWNYADSKVETLTVTK